MNIYMKTTMQAPRNAEESAYSAYNRAMGVYLATETDHISVPADMFDAPISEYVALDPAFALLEMRRLRMERAYQIWQAAKAEVVEQPTLPGVA